MKEKDDILIERRNAREAHVSFRNHGNLALLKYDYIRFALKELITSSYGTKLIIDLTGVKFIDSTAFDTLNLLSRLGRRYNSSITLTGVEPEVMEMISLVKKYSVFDINHIQTAGAEVA